MTSTVVAFTVIFCLDKILYKNYLILNKFDNRVASAIHDYITNIICVITLRLEQSVWREVATRLGAAYSLYRNHNILHVTKGVLLNLMIGSMIVAVLIWYTNSTIGAGKAVLAGTFFTLFEYLRRIGGSFSNFANLYGGIVRQAADVQSADTIVNAHNALVPSHETHKLPSDWKKLEIRHLCFTYEDEKHRAHHLDHVALDIVRGTSIALVGQSGAGKSTLLNLIRGMQPADEVTVICDGNVLPGKLRHLAEHTTLMPQDPEIFSDTIRFNISFGFAVDEEELNKVIAMSRFQPVLDRLPLRLETNIAEKGVNLSGGEKQRLALARFIHFAKESDIVLMDEPTSSVDIDNERLIYANLLSEFQDRCVISSIHRLHLLELFDFIYVFQDGIIVEQGTFGELVSKSGVLASMWKNYQADTAIVDDNRYTVRNSLETVAMITPDVVEVARKGRRTPLSLLLVAPHEIANTDRNLAKQRSK